MNDKLTRAFVKKVKHDIEEELSLLQSQAEAASEAYALNKLDWGGTVVREAFLAGVKWHMEKIKNK